MSEHAQSTLEDAAHWREVVRLFVECGIDPRDITPDWIAQKVKRQIGFGYDYIAPEYTGWRCYEDVEYHR